MSQRSIIEINHDYSHVIARDELRFTQLLLSALASGSDMSWDDLERFGIRRIVQCHHSDDRKVVAFGREFPIG